MNKLGIFLCFLLTISYIKSEDTVDVNQLYDKFLSIATGLTDGTEYKCKNLLIQNRAKIVGMVEESIKNKEDAQTILMKIAASFIFVPGFSTNCNVNEIIKVVLEITKAAGIRKMGQNMIDNADRLEQLFAEMKEKTEETEKLEVIGKIARIITGISFH